VSSRWIKLALHPEHPKVFRMAKVLGQTREVCFAMSVRWFRAVDADKDLMKRLTDGEVINALAVAKDGVDFASACADPLIAWLVKEGESGYSITNPDEWFIKDADNAERARKYRERVKNARSSRDDRALQTSSSGGAPC
jgi:hypothetical protein